MAAYRRIYAATQEEAMLGLEMLNQGRCKPDGAEQIRLDLAHQGVLVHDLGGIVETACCRRNEWASFSPSGIAARTSSRRDFASFMSSLPL
jgi:hypothetical protein